MRSTLIAGLFGVSLLVLALPAQALYVHDMCGGTPSEGAGMTCPPGDYYSNPPVVFGRHVRRLGLLSEECRGPEYGLQL